MKYSGFGVAHLVTYWNVLTVPLRASLLLVARSCKNQSHGMLTVLNQVATSSIPYRIDHELKAARKREEKRERSRKYQSQSWDLEKQNQIRAERAARKKAKTEQTC
ncbi:hypothetical protein F5X99DRAFT_377950 [Biscogniauxia marginata]|nr:hypothetical protein F5X99DRAFT_377950 [Biscogniauxia marginata]